MLLPHGTRRMGGIGSGGGHNNNGAGGAGSLFVSSRMFMLILASAIPAFFLGTTVTLYATVESAASSCSLQDPIMQSHIKDLLLQKEAEIYKQHEAAIERKVQEQLQQLGCSTGQVARKAVAAGVVQHEPLTATRRKKGEVYTTQEDLLDASKIGNFVRGMALLPKSNLTNTLDFGVPLDQLKEGSDHVLMLYSRDQALPNILNSENPINVNQPSSLVQIPVLDMETATSKCDYLHVILTDHSKQRNQCLAIIPQYESFHIQKWMRIDEKTGKLDSQLPLQLVSRGQKATGRNEFDAPGIKYTRRMWDMLKQYLDSVDEVLKELDAVLKPIATDNTVIVMVCNFGQSELLMNFVCSAKKRNFDISNIVVFSTDQETTDLANNLGLATYYDKRNFGDIPPEAAKRYGDRRFTAMMMAKVICVQLVSMLGYDFLFQDVDIIWYSNPLDYFRDPTIAAHQYDVFFQDDGGHSIRYAPYSANSGFYFVRHNDRTRHFLTSLLMAGDLVLETDSHQQALIALLNEHVSLYGLKAKVLSRDLDEFPGGYQWNQKSGKFMKRLFSGEVTPIIFHMSWTLNKDNKLLYFRQMGEWYVQEACVAKKIGEISMTTGSDLTSTCCAAEALFSCHYRDKPSKHPCKDSPPIDKGRPSFW